MPDGKRDESTLCRDIVKLIVVSCVGALRTVVTDPVHPDDVYVGADIGVWYSPNGGRSWQPLPNGLPDAPIFELLIHPTRHRCGRPRTAAGSTSTPWKPSMPR